MSTMLQRDRNEQSSEAQVPAPNSQRRRFLFALGAGGAGAAAVVTHSLAPIAQVTTPESVAVSSGYRETQHVRDYYETTRL